MLCRHSRMVHRTHRERRDVCATLEADFGAGISRTEPMMMLGNPKECGVVESNPLLADRRVRKTCRHAKGEVGLPETFGFPHRGVCGKQIVLPQVPMCELFSYWQANVVTRMRSGRNKPVPERTGPAQGNIAYGRVSLTFRSRSNFSILPRRFPPSSRASRNA